MRCSWGRCQADRLRRGRRPWLTERDTWRECAVVRRFEKHGRATHARAAPGRREANEEKADMFAAERRQLILDMVRTSGAVSLRELARAVQTSEVTVRRDLRALEA